MGSQCSGGWAEQQALQQLEAQGWRLLDRNWHCRWGELDLVLERQQQLLVVEVKGRRTGHRDRHGLDAFHSAKRRRVGLEVTELLLLFGIQPPLTTSLYWRLVKAAVLIRHVDGLTTCSHH